MDYYDVLNVAKNASSDEIKKSYRQKSMKFHPDRNPDPNAAVEMGKINEAYEILRDANKRRMYDMESSMPMNMHDLMTNLFTGGMTGMAGMGGMAGMAEMAGMGGMGGMGGIGINIGEPEVHFFSGSIHDIFDKLQRPPAIQKQVHISLEEAYFGTNRTIEVDKWSIIGGRKINETVKIEMFIQSGVRHHETITVENKGNKLNERIIGNIDIVIIIEDHDLFQRENDDLIFHKTIALKDALCGFSFEFTHLNKKTYLLNNEKNHMVVYPGFHKTINGLGFQRNGQNGNLIIIFNVDFPEKISSENIEILKNVL